MATPDPKNAVAIETGVYTIQNKATSTKFLYLKGGATAHNTPVVGHENLFSKITFFHENWYIQPVPGEKNVYTILNVTSGTAVGLEAGALKNGKPIECHASDHQKWFFLKNDDKSYTIVHSTAVHENLRMVIDLEENHATKVQGWTYVAPPKINNNQRWFLTPRHLSIQSVQNLLVNSKLVTQLPNYYSSARLYIVPPHLAINEAHDKLRKTIEARKDVDRDTWISILKGNIALWGLENVRVPVGLLFGTLGSVAPTAAKIAWNWTLTEDLTQITLFDPETGKAPASTDNPATFGSF